MKLITVVVKRNRLELSEVPSILKSILYLLVTGLFSLSVWKSPKLGFGIFDEYIWLIFWGLFFLYVSRRQSIGFFRLVNSSWKKTVKVAFFVLVADVLMSLVGTKLQAVPDPQGLANNVYTIKQVLIMVGLTPFIGVQEELYKLLVFLAFCGLMRSGRFSTIIIATLVTSGVFGIMHIINYPITAALPIALSAIPGFIFMLYFRSILPMIIEHAFFDALHTFSHWNGDFGALLLEGLYVVIILVLFVQSTIRNKRTNKKKTNAETRGQIHA